MKKTHSPVVFWLKQLIYISLILIGGIIAERLVNHSHSNSGSKPENDLSPGESFSHMYSNFRLSSRQPYPTNTSDFVIDLPAATVTLSERLAQLKTPYPATEDELNGMDRYRSFRQGNTLQESLTRHLEQNGLSLLWDLQQDFVIKNRFETKGTLTHSVKVIASSIQHNFTDELHLLKCPNQRAIVITTDQKAQSNADCSAIK